MEISKESKEEMLSGRGTKDDSGKIRTSLYPADAFMAISDVFTYGANKYSPDNWRNGMSYRRMLDALIRHVMAYNGGEEFDKESGKHHLAHAGCCTAMLLSYNLNPSLYNDNDDRWIPHV